MSHMLDKDTVNRIMHLHKVQGLKAGAIAERFGFSSSRVHGVLRRQAASSKLQAPSATPHGTRKKSAQPEVVIYNRHPQPPAKDK